MYKFMLILFFIKFSTCLYDEYEQILKVTADNFEDCVEFEKKPIILHAYSPQSQECKSIVKKFVAVSEELRDIVKFACIQIDKQKDLMEELGTTEPNKFFIIQNGQIQQFTGPINSRYILSLVMNQVHDSDAVQEKRFKYFFENVVQLNDENFETTTKNSNRKPWMILFYSQKLSESKHMIPIWYQTAEIMKKSVNFGSVDCTKNPKISKEYDLAGYPTGVLLIREATYYLHYNVHLKPDFIMEWIRNKINEYEEESMLNELSTQYHFEKCIEKPFCVIAFLPNILDCQTKCRNNLLKILTEIHEKYMENNWGWLWSEIDSQGDLERALEIDDHIIPTIIFIDTHIRKFGQLRGSFTESDINNFLQDMLKQKIPINNLKKHIKIHEKDIWNGKDLSDKKTVNSLDYFDVNVMDIKDEL